MFNESKAAFRRVLLPGWRLGAQRSASLTGLALLALLVILAPGRAGLSAASGASQLGDVFAEFTQSTIVTQNVVVTPGADFQFSEFYQIWRIIAPGGGFQIEFDSLEATNFVLQVQHLSSAYALCPGGGYSPVTIRMNGTNLVENFDPAENHLGSHGFETDAWRVPVQAGANTLEWIAGELCTHYWIRRLDILPSPEVTADLALGGLHVSPTDFARGDRPIKVSLWITNHGPSAVAQEFGRVGLDLFLSGDEMIDPAEDLRVGRCLWDLNLPAGSWTNVDLPLDLLASLRIPGQAGGDYRVIGRLLPASPSTLVDPNLTDNVLVADFSVHVTPAGHGIYADFTFPEIASAGMTVQPSPCFFFNWTVGYCWWLLCRNYPAFYATFDVPADGEYLLNVRHLTSASGQCPGGGYSPISIYLNGVAVVENFDPAEHHDGSHGFEVDSWRISAQAHDNVLELLGGELCTSYWIQRIEVVPVDAPVRLASILRLPSGAMELTLTAPPYRTARVETSSNLQTWTALTNWLHFTGSAVVRDDAARLGEQRFYRAVVEP